MLSLDIARAYNTKHFFKDPVLTIMLSASGIALVYMITRFLMFSNAYSKQCIRANTGSLTRWRYVRFTVLVFQFDFLCEHLSHHGSMKSIFLMCRTSRVPTPCKSFSKYSPSFTDIFPIVILLCVQHSVFHPFLLLALFNNERSTS